MKHTSEHSIANQNKHFLLGIATLISWISLTGCTLVPEARVRESLHNPFPQLKRVAIVPFFNQSQQPNVDGRQVAQAYYAALQSIPGFEVLPVGVTELQWRQFASLYGEPQTGQQFQKLAQMMDVEAIVVGSVTDFQSYYPPRMAMTVHWYTANEGFHTIPPGYGLPWGTEHEEKIPSRIVRDAEFELARSQLKTQTPQPIPPETSAPPTAGNPLRDESNVALTEATDADATIDAADYQEVVAEHQIEVPSIPHGSIPGDSPIVPNQTGSLNQTVIDPNQVTPQDMPMADSRSPMLASDGYAVHAELSPDGAIDPALFTYTPPIENWPDPTDLIPDPPSPVPPPMTRQHKPVLTHTKLHRGDDPYFTERLADYVETGDDARGTSWQGYLKRSDDFIRFCCYLHVVEMLESRGGRDPSELILRWPVSRY